MTRGLAPGCVAILIFGDRQVATNLERGALAYNNMEPALEVIATDMMRVEEATFSGQGRRFGGSWHALDPDTVKRKVAMGQDPRTLIATRALLDSMTQRGDPNQELEISGSFLVFGSRLDYAPKVQAGTSRMPARPFVEFYPQDRRRWAKTCAEYVRGAMAGV